MTYLKRCIVELMGTFWLVFAGCGSAVIAAGFPDLGIGFLGVALAFGLSVLTMAYAFGDLSGGHFNPAVSFGLAACGRFSIREVPGYLLSQLGGALLASSVLYLIASGLPEFSLEAGFAANGYGEHSPAGYNLLSCGLAEGLLTYMFVMLILGVTDDRAPKGFAPLAIGLALTLIHLISIPITNTSVNPARSTGPAIFVGGWALEQLWLFWLAPVTGAILSGVTYRALFKGIALAGGRRITRREDLAA
jgi:aquaporin Z